MENYFNPQSVNPQNAYKPDGFLGGYLWQQDRNRYNQLAPLQDFLAMMGAKQQMNQMQEYDSNAPLREAQRRSGIATADATTATIGRSKEAGVEETELKNKFNQGTLQSRIADTLATNAAAEGERGFAKLKQGLMMSQLMAGAAAQGPAAVAALRQQMQQSGVDIEKDPLAQAMIQNPKLAKVLADAHDQAIPAFRQKMAEQKLENEGRAQVAHISGGYSVARDKAKAASKVKSVAQLFAEANTDEKVLRLWHLIKDDDDIPIDKKNSYRAAAEQADKNLQAKDAARQPPALPGMPNNPPRARLGGGGSQPGAPGTAENPIRLD